VFAYSTTTNTNTVHMKEISLLSMGGGTIIRKKPIHIPVLQGVDTINIIILGNDV
jgi:hypothetical protein